MTHLSKKPFSAIFIILLISGLLMVTFDSLPLAKAAEITFVQGHAKGVSLASASTDVTMISVPTNGNKLVASIGVRTGVAPPPTVDHITQTGVSWIKLKSATSGVLDVEVWLGVVGADASTSLSVVLTGAPDNGTIVDVCEYAGLVNIGYLDQTGSASGSSTTPNTGAISNTAQDQELWVGAICARGYTQTAATNGFTLRDGAYNSTAGISLAYLDYFSLTAGTASSSTTISGSNSWVGCIVTLRNTPPSGIVTVQGPIQGTSVAEATVNATLSLTPLEGDVIVAGVGIRSNTAPPPNVLNITQSGVTWQKVSYKVYSVLATEIWVGVVGANASTSIIVYLDDTPDTYGCTVDFCEYNGVAATGFVDKTATNFGSSVNPNTGQTLTTYKNNELFIGVTCARGYSQTDPTNGFALKDGAYNSSTGVSIGYLEKSTIVNVKANCSTTISTATTWVGCIATFSTTEIVPAAEYSSVVASTNIYNTTCTFSSKWSSDNALSFYSFCSNITSTMANHSFTAFTGNPQRVSVNVTLPPTIGTTIEYMWYANDSNGNWNFTEPAFLTTASLAPELVSFIQWSDTQFIAETYPSLFEETAQAIASEVAPNNVIMTWHTGDIVDDNTNDAEWTVASNSFMILADNGIPYSWSAGNHDQIATNGIGSNNGMTGSPNGSWVGYNYTAFNLATFRAQPYYVSDYALGKNTAVKASYGGFDFLIINLEYFANSSAFSWADTLIAQYSTYRIIINTHMYMNSTGGYSSSDNGDNGVWEAQLTQRAQTNSHIILITGGHTGTKGVWGYSQQQSTFSEWFFNRQGINGTVTDGRYVGQGAASFVLFTLNLTSGVITAKTYDVLQDAYMTQENTSPFTYNQSTFTYNSSVKNYGQTIMGIPSNQITNVIDISKAYIRKINGVS